MEKKWLFVIGVLIILILTAISILGITSTTGSVIYGKCWGAHEQISQNSEIALKAQGCIVEPERNRVCCPFETCPNAEEIKCGP
jgi:hypothetical protein